MKVENRLKLPIDLVRASILITLLLSNFQAACLPAE